MEDLVRLFFIGAGSVSVVWILKFIAEAVENKKKVNYWN